VASRFGRLTIRRQILAEGAGTGTGTGTGHVMPGNAVLPPHGGIVITRGLQEMACLLPDTLPFVTATRLLGWQTHEDAAEVVCASTGRTVVREHGAALAEGRAGRGGLAHRPAGARRGQALRPRLCPAREPRRRAGWPPERGAAVDQALADGEARPPRGVRLADWERVLQVRREEWDTAREGEADLRHLGPRIGPREVVVSADEVLTRRPQRRQFWEVRTARVATAEGYRSVSGTGAPFLATLGVLCALCQGAPAGETAAADPPRRVILLADGARWLRDFFATTLAPRGAIMLLDWSHVRSRCYQTSTHVCRDKPTRLRFQRALRHLLWRGDGDGAIAAAEGFRAEAKAPPDPRRPAPLDEWISYLDARRATIPC